MTSGEECVEYPRVEVDAFSCMIAMRNTMAGVTGKLTASSGRECNRSFQDENKTVTSGEEFVEHPRVVVDAVSCMNAMRNTMAGVTCD